MKQRIVGLLPAPELPERVVHQLTQTLPNLLGNHVDGDVEWKVECLTDPLTGAAETAREILEETEARKRENDWDYAICLTDLPVTHEGNIVLSDVDRERSISQLSLPAFGFVPMKKRIAEVMVNVMGEMHTPHDSNQPIADKKLKRMFSAIRSIAPSGDEHCLQLIVVPRFIGWLRLVLGMIYANRPWSTMPSFKGVVAIAFATGAYSLIFPSVWKISEAFQGWRFVLLMVTAIFAMVAWIIFSHELWEKPSQRSKSQLRRLYNITTVSTLSVAVLIYYALVLVLFFIVVRIFVPADLFAIQVGLGDGVTIIDYIELAWLAASLATLAGALGAGLENAELVRNVTYGYRQQRRYEEMHRDKSNS
ncbi:hypothetical protein N781_06680 [Pontibacillus halophilus JSM 076056 = DSM 19796]|uniref:5,10-methylene-tetrahydrofolate dehydrogenase n=1 Tax=Pontibacillus halophilus JSM 076056 = DSM 19796 TaxID=1385510 RepID=A0A0A5GC52_9BACI|nr:hypothetical protein [Pontibacillus halophilus]KGX90766.1 hypothetical protein N781_06680 [Pontibacillus halophilus JSM 076056 = DSM 19796]